MENLFKIYRKYALARKLKKMYPGFQAITPTPMTLDTEFPCIVMFKDTGFNREMHYTHINDMIKVVGYRSNQEPHRHLNCPMMKYPFHGMIYSSFDVVGVPDKQEHNQ